MKTLKTILTIAAAAALSLAYIKAASADEPQSELSRHDHLKIAAQEICPVSGKPLGSMGTPLKRKIGEEELFLCCAGCDNGKVSREHWATIHNNFAKAQGKCPVMGKDLPAGAKWTIVDGQLFYVCCPPCIDKIQADPATYMAKLDELYLANTGSTIDRGDLRMAVQAICPVSGKPLGSMGTPLKARIGDEDLYLCCEACTQGKVERSHWATIHANFAKAQKTCPVMEQDLPANPKWTVVNGQIVYVCCPPCTKKIQADPKTYLNKLDALYRTSIESKAPADRERFLDQ